MLRARLRCEVCSAKVGRDVRHAKIRACSLVQAQARYNATDKAKAATRLRVARLRAARKIALDSENSAACS